MNCLDWILVVDDDEDTREMLTLLLGLEGYQVAGAVDGLDALEQIRAHGRPALILLDLRMPRMNGRDFTQALREDTALASTPIVVLSGDAVAGGWPTSLDVVDCLTKPVDLAVLISTVARIVPPQEGAGPHHPD